MKHLPLRVAFLITMACFGIANMHGEMSERRKQELLETYQDRYASADGLPNEEKEFLKNWILGELDNPERTSNYRFTKQLLQLGYEPAIKSFGDNYPGLTHEQSIALRDLRQPRVLEYMAPHVFVKEPGILPQTSDVPLWPRSVDAAGHMLMVLESSREVPTPVRVWAMRLQADVGQTLGNGSRLRDLVRDWWRENGEACKAREFEKLKPGESFRKESLPSPAPEPLKNVLAPPEPPPIAATPAGESLRTEDQAPDSGGYWWLALAALICLLGAALVFIARRRPEG